MPILDANVILRYLLGDIPEQSAEAQKAVLSGAATTAEVLAEVVYVLAGVYHKPWGMLSACTEKAPWILWTASLPDISTQKISPY